MNAIEPFSCPPAKGGSILILVLWVIFLLALVAVAVGAMVESRINLARHLRDRSLAWHAARAGVVHAVTLLEADTNAWDGVGDAWYDDSTAFSNHVSGGGVYTLFRCQAGADGGTAIRYGLDDEQARIDLNNARTEVLKALFQYAGPMEPETAARVAVALKTATTPLPEGSPALTSDSGWVSDDLPRGPLRSVPELRWIRGMTTSVLSNITALVTVHGGYRVNINTADAPVLGLLMRATGRGSAGSVESLTRKILQFRERGGIFKNLQLGDAFGPGDGLTAEEQSLLGSLLPYVTVASRHFRGCVDGGVDGGAVLSRRIEFIWDRNHKRIEFWHED